MSAEDRDRQFEQALARHLRSDARGPADSGCLDAETLAAYHEKSLVPEEMSAASAHLEHCPRCSETLAMLATMEVATGHAEPVSAITREAKKIEPLENPSAKVAAFPRKKSLLRWAAAVAAVLFLWIAVREYRSAKQTANYIAQNREETALKVAPPVTKQQAQVPAPSVEPLRQGDKMLDDKTSDKASRDDFAFQQKSKTAVPPPPPASAPVLHEQSRENERALRSPSIARSALAPPNAQKKVAAQQPADRVASSDETNVPASRSESVEVTAAAPRVRSPDSDLNLRKDQAGAGASEGALGGVAGAPVAKAAAPRPLPPPPAPQANPGTAQSPSKPGYSGDKTAASDGLRSTAQSVELSGAEVIGRSTQSLLPANLSTLPVRVASPDGTHLWRFGQSGLVAYSSDSGGTWIAQPSGVTQSLTSGSAPSDKVCWIAGAAGTLLRTTDGGKHWKIIVTPISGDLGGVLATDKRHATIWDPPDRLRYVTTDGGSTWTPAANP